MGASWIWIWSKTFLLTIEHGHLRQNVIDYFSDIARSSSRNKTKNNKSQTEKQYYKMFTTSVARSANFDLKFLSR